MGPNGAPDGLHSVWRVHSCSSEGDVHTASNVLKEELFRIWQTREPADEAWIILEAQPPAAFNEIEIVNAGSAIVELFGLKSDSQSDNLDDYEMLLSAQQVMTSKDLGNKINRNRAFTYHITNKLAQQAAEQRWRRIRIDCRQPFGSEDHKAYIGLSRLNFKLCKTSEEIAAKAAEVYLQENVKTGFAKMVQDASLDISQKIISQVTAPTGQTIPSKAEQSHEPVIENNRSPSPLVTRAKRRLPSWSLVSKENNPVKKTTKDKEGSFDSEATLSKEESKNAANSMPNQAAESNVGKSKGQKGAGTSQGIKTPQSKPRTDCSSSGQKKRQLSGPENTTGETDTSNMDGSFLKTRRKDRMDPSSDSTSSVPDVTACSQQDAKAPYKGQRKGQPPQSGVISQTNKGEDSHKHSKVPDKFHSSKDGMHAESSKKDEKENQLDSQSINKSGQKTGRSEKALDSQNFMTSKDTETSDLKSVDNIARPFSKFLDGVLFAISGLLNPERGYVREKAQEMGGQYRSDWSSDCTMLLCAFANTPKFNQVKKENGTIVSKDWILECHRRRELLEIDSYIMHAGNPWRQTGASVRDEYKEFDNKAISKDILSISSFGSDKTLQNVSAKEEYGREGSMKTVANLSKVQQWVHEDVASSIAWLKQQENQPEDKELKTVAIQGILLCLDDAIECLHGKQRLKNVLESWAFVPWAVQELAAREDTADRVGKLSQKDILYEAERLKWIYLAECNKLKVGEKPTFQEGKEVIEHEEDDDATEMMSDDRIDESLDWESDGTELLDEDFIKEAQENISKMLTGY